MGMAFGRAFCRFSLTIAGGATVGLELIFPVPLNSICSKENVRCATLQAEWKRGFSRFPAPRAWMAHGAGVAEEARAQGCFGRCS